MKIKIAIIDDHFAVRDGYKSVLNTFDFVAQIDTFSNSSEFFKINKIQFYDLVLLDVELKGENGILICEKIKMFNNLVKVVVLSSFHSAEYIISSYENQVDGYLFKDTDYKNFKQKIEQIMVYSIPAFEEEAQNIIFEYLNRKNGVKKEQSKLTETELEIVKLICAGKSVKEIALISDRSEATISTHKQNIMRKLDLHKSIDLYRWAEKSGVYIPEFYISRSYKN